MQREVLTTANSSSITRLSADRSASISRAFSVQATENEHHRQTPAEPHNKILTPSSAFTHTDNGSCVGVTNRPYN